MYYIRYTKDICPIIFEEKKRYKAMTNTEYPSCNNVAPVTNLCLGRVSEHLGFYY